MRNKSAPSRKVKLEARLKAKLSSRADHAEADFASGRVHTHEAVVAHFQAKRMEEAEHDRMTAMAIRSEEAIKVGDVMTLAEARNRSKRLIRKITGKATSSSGPS